MRIYKNSGKILGLLVISSALISLCIIGTVSASATAADAASVTAPPVSEARVDQPQAGNVASPAHELLPVLLAAPSGVLPGTVYVFNDGRVVTEMPLITGASPSTGGNDVTAPVASAAVAAQFTVVPSRIVVVDSQDEVMEIWNNTCPGDGFYCLKVKEQDGHGPEHPLTPRILERYNSLLPEIDWAEPGEVYQG